MSNDLCEKLNHIVFDSSDPEKHDQLQHGLSQWEKKCFGLREEATGHHGNVSTSGSHSGSTQKAEGLKNNLNR